MSFFLSFYRNIKMQSLHGITIQHNYHYVVEARKEAEIIVEEYLERYHANEEK